MEKPNPFSQKLNELIQRAVENNETGQITLVWPDKERQVLLIVLPQACAMQKGTPPKVEAINAIPLEN